jgi:hypothetical protein
VAFLSMPLACISMCSLGLVATQTPMFLFDSAGGPAAMEQRPEEAYRGVLAGHRRLIRVGLGAHGG